MNASSTLTQNSSPVIGIVISGSAPERELHRIANALKERLEGTDGVLEVSAHLSEAGTATAAALRLEDDGRWTCRALELALDAGRLRRSDRGTS